MGNAAAIKLDEKCATNPHTGATCMRLRYTAPDNFGGVEPCLSSKARLGRSLALPKTAVRERELLSVTRPLPKN